MNQKLLLAGLLAAIGTSPGALTAQVLEEVVVTAQRREQSLQDVPISVQTLSGEDISRQGFRTLNDLSAFAPGLVITESAEENGLLIRGAGTQGKNLAFEQGAPTFVDGIHFGRASSVKSFFMDLERIEVLRGPQPIFFGQNASAGALNITSRRPTPEWEGNVDAEIGNFGRQSVEAGIGGPLTDTLGIRIAGRYDQMDGFLEDWMTGEMFPMREAKVGRVTLQWRPMEQLQIVAKLEAADQDLGGRAQAIARDRFPEEEFNLADGESVYLTGLDGLLREGIADAEVGKFTNLGASRLGPFLAPTGYTQANSRNSGGFLDMTACTPGMLSNPDDPEHLQPPEPYVNCDFAEQSGSKPWHGLLEANYLFGNGMELQSLTGFSRQTFNHVRNSGGPFVSNPRHRAEDFNQWSSELRLTSPTGGTFEWMAGLYWQNNDLEVESNVWRMNARRAIRGNRSSEEAEWLSGFATVTYNFLDNRASLDIGGRYTDISKFGKSQNLAAEWIVYDPIADAPFILPYGRSIGSSAYPHLQNAVIVGRTPLSTDRSQFQPGSSVSVNRVASVQNDISESSFDPQIVLRYRPTDNVSTYLKYATAFKAGGFDMAVSEVTAFAEDFVFGPESAEIFEAGVRGSFLNNRATAELTLFHSTFDDLQVSYIDRLIDRNITKNAAKSRSVGAEFGVRMAVSDRLTVAANGIIMEAELVSFPDAVCTTEEVDLGLCDPVFEVIDRSGQPMRNAPDWQMMANSRYEMPILDSYKSTLDATFMASDGYITDRAWQKTVRMDTEVDLNLSASIGPEDDTWRITLYGRNLFAPKPTYFPEDDATGEGIIFESLSPSNFTSYGVKFGYSFF